MRGPREGGSRSGDGRREHGNTDPFSVGEEMHPIPRDVAEDLGDRLMREMRGGAAKRDDESVHGFSDPPSRTPSLTPATVRFAGAKAEVGTAIAL